MVQANIDNEPVYVVLGNSESITVPTGETWTVTITGTNNASSTNQSITIDGFDYPIALSDANDEMNMVLTEGTTIQCDAYAQIHITGWKV